MLTLCITGLLPRAVNLAGMLRTDHSGKELITCMFSALCLIEPCMHLAHPDMESVSNVIVNAGQQSCSSCVLGALTDVLHSTRLGTAIGAEQISGGLHHTTHAVRSCAACHAYKSYTCREISVLGKLEDQVQGTVKVVKIWMFAKTMPCAACCSATLYSAAIAAQVCTRGKGWICLS